MRICIDVQSMQTGSRFRGMGRYVSGLVDGILRNQNEHEVFILINGEQKESSFTIREKFKGLIPDDHFIDWFAPTPLAFCQKISSLNRHDASAIYQYAVLRCNPDLFILTSAVEGASEEFFWSIDEIKQYCRVGSVIYDFIPAEQPEKYLSNPIAAEYYWGQMEKIKDFDVLFSISEFVAEKTRERFPHIPVLNISSAVEESFRPVASDEKNSTTVLSAYGISNPFIFYAGGADDRKNVASLLDAYSLLDAELRSSYQLVIVCGKNEHAYKVLDKKRIGLGLTDQECILLGYVSDDELIAFYSACSLFVFPSFEEGFGLTILEAMQCGAPAICSNRTSMPEVLGYEKGLFDPSYPENISQVIKKYLTDLTSREVLRAHCAEQAKKFSWEITAQRVLDFDYASLPAKKVFTESSSDALIRFCAEQFCEKEHTDEQLMLLAKALAATFSR